jgi:CubicO group peptidase (beta-lactamase class C family)
MKKTLARVVGMLMMSLPSVQVFSNEQPIEHAEPEEVGFSSTQLEQVAAFLEEAGSSAMMILVDGNVIFEWGAVEKKHTIHSMRKALLNSLYGIKVSEGVIDLEATLENLQVDDIFPLSKDEKRARIIDLLKSRSGVYHPAAGVSQGMLQGMPERNTFAPDEHFYYNNWDFNVLGAILEKKTSRSLYTLFYEEIALPLGMTSFKGTFTTVDGESEEATIPETDGFYQLEKSKSKYPAHHFRMTASDLARYGLLYLNKGKWNGRQLVPEEWIEKSTVPYSIINEEFGICYGMLWYVLVNTESKGENDFFHTGAGVHMLAVFPGADMVLVHRVDTENEYSFKNQYLYQLIEMVFSAQEEQAG